MLLLFEDLGLEKSVRFCIFPEHGAVSFEGPEKDIVKVQVLLENRNIKYEEPSPAHPLFCNLE